ncbi:MAG: hypothetical protein A2087_11250 [Spirochaetes bacterium GWD1_61_31]|nr:MAG: hypothetical protein A2Y37_04535 [Spirochaetes bacterium GWB1_60_80]OHD32637.1 MAG: hypothetical protein A2004_06000 [Spirochaetes bacterium GWC1_61_12]OHD35739.1 MAG: hypothetical protein A2087_11250 [Spirochaetes bacterium GWD1_61_31]OHD41905.1 MAG: hypothetical protein A2Y35_04595 [Spirochaetes bacterium GWE1_60_18]OHD57880.1 MAG: hypothetical protein A2Y32_10865 [Spirochaetes bacterium GWF1_60_12]HAP44339.1 B12-binding domain-containing radical SAM protein [Spirochaetaceae bacteriu
MTTPAGKPQGSHQPLGLSIPTTIPSTSPASTSSATTAETRPALLFVSLASQAGPRSAPLGAAQILAYLYKQADIRAGLALALLAANADDPPAELLAKVLAARPAILALSVYVWNYPSMLNLAIAARQQLPGLIIVAGGPEAGGDASSSLRAGLADYVVSGEGELAMARLLRAWLDGSLPPIDAAPARRSFCEPVASLEALPSPWLDGSLQLATYGGAVWELTRGCPFQCAFCYESRGNGPARREFGLDRLEKELRLFGKQAAAEVFALDPTFNAEPKRMQQLLKLIARLAPNSLYFFELRAELLTAQQADWLTSVNCQVQLGLQSADPAALALVNRRFDPEQFKAKISLLEERGIIYGLDLIYGLPGDSLEGFNRSLDYALELRPNHLDIFPLAVLPGTLLAAQAAELGLECQSQAPHRILSTPGFGAADLDRAARLADAVELFYNRGRAVMWFMPLCQALHEPPARLLERFALFLEGQPLVLQAEANHTQLEGWQLEFLAPSLATLPDELRLVAEETIKVAGAWTRALAEGEESQLKLHWHPEDLLDCGCVALDEVLDECDPTTASWWCRAGTDGPLFQVAKG